MKADQLGA